MLLRLVQMCLHNRMGFTLVHPCWTFPDAEGPRERWQNTSVRKDEEMENDHMDILFGLAAAVCLGTSDFLARFATRRVGTYRTLFYVQVVGFFALSLFLLAIGAWARINFIRDWQAWGWTVVVALLDTASYFALYRAFETGLLMVVSVRCEARNGNTFGGANHLRDGVSPKIPRLIWQAGDNEQEPV